MDKSLSKFLLDDWEWYKMGILIGFILFCLIAAGQMPNLPTTPSLLASMGLFWLSLGEYVNHPRQERLVERNGKTVLEIAYPRVNSLIGYFFTLLGIVFSGLSIYFFYQIIYF
ncbi:hypothetical protein [Avibacterium paragallinarum]|uniref:Uncharacterized protein n=1 Tax=Avibacterium paragallinarum TaxID=728 RepID=A0A2S5AYZ8_AVIPA|nr:hypothetical protein [Avibacterium paragallinarum]MEE3609374.1 hypothetical protein [Avibacterium paragallinarum]MEE3621502.1 hypothetical protein [Avibacterium paragallinarum]MEE3669357.1 hypothetical protein [Avibacterium paragallinarum]MEE3681661.1 hypothetical protein [Avibacterium paragallinarum]MEE4386663.1 hypothetical protein [Avibacterium paragallinarum]